MPVQNNPQSSEKEKELIEKIEEKKTKMARFASEIDKHQKELTQNAVLLSSFESSIHETLNLTKKLNIQKMELDSVPTKISNEEASVSEISMYIELENNLRNAVHKAAEKAKTRFQMKSESVKKKHANAGAPSVQSKAAALLAARMAALGIQQTHSSIQISNISNDGATLAQEMAIIQKEFDDTMMEINNASDRLAHLSKLIPKNFQQNYTASKAEEWAPTDDELMKYDKGSLKSTIGVKIFNQIRKTEGFPKSNTNFLNSIPNPSEAISSLPEAVAQDPARAVVPPIDNYLNEAEIALKESRERIARLSSMSPSSSVNEINTSKSIIPQINILESTTAMPSINPHIPLKTVLHSSTAQAGLAPPRSNIPNQPASEFNMPHIPEYKPSDFPKRLSNVVTSSITEIKPESDFLNDRVTHNPHMTAVNPVMNSMHQINYLDLERVNNTALNISSHSPPKSSEKARNNQTYSPQSESANNYDSSLYQYNPFVPKIQKDLSPSDNMKNPFSKSLEIGQYSDSESIISTASSVKSRPPSPVKPMYLKAQPTIKSPSPKVTNLNIAAPPPPPPPPPPISQIQTKTFFDSKIQPELSHSDSMKNPFSKSIETATGQYSDSESIKSTASSVKSLPVKPIYLTAQPTSKSPLKVTPPPPPPPPPISQNQAKTLLNSKNIMNEDNQSKAKKSGEFINILTDALKNRRGNMQSDSEAESESGWDTSSEKRSGSPSRINASGIASPIRTVDKIVPQVAQISPTRALKADPPSVSPQPPVIEIDKLSAVKQLSAITEEEKSKEKVPISKDTYQFSEAKNDTEPDLFSLRSKEEAVLFLNADDCERKSQLPSDKASHIDEFERDIADKTFYTNFSNFLLIIY